MAATEQLFESKLSDSAAVVIFDFLSELALGDFVTTPVVTAEVYSGTDASPTAIIFGSPTTDGYSVTQVLVGGVLGVVYTLRCLAGTNDGLTIIKEGKLAVV